MRRRRRRSRIAIPLVIIAVGAAGGWWFWPRGDGQAPDQVSGSTGESPSIGAADSPRAGVPEAVIVAAEPTTPTPDEVLTPIGASDPAGTANAGPAAPESGPPPTSANPPTSDTSPTGQLSSNPRINASLQSYRAGRVLEARNELNRMLMISKNAAEQAEIRRHLQQIANESVFSRQPVPNDPLIETYTIQPGDVLVNIGKQFNVPHEIIMRINGIEDAARIRAGQIIKVPRGPFNVKIYKSQFRLDVYLQDLYVRSYPVGLGANQATPDGEWQVKDRLSNPTYYPPASAESKRIIPPDDPENPLGEYWIGLEGVGGDAMGRDGYGIHGTIDPTAIGRAVSLGCVRMHNEDVEFLYGLMMPGQSKVTILP